MVILLYLPREGRLDCQNLPINPPKFLQSPPPYRSFFTKVILSLSDPPSCVLPPLSFRFFLLGFFSPLTNLISPEFPRKPTSLAIPFALPYAFAAEGFRLSAFPLDKSAVI